MKYKPSRSYKQRLLYIHAHSLVLGIIMCFSAKPGLPEVTSFLKGRIMVRLFSSLGPLANLFLCGQAVLMRGN